MDDEHFAGVRPPSTPEIPPRPGAREHVGSPNGLRFFIQHPRWSAFPQATDTSAPSNDVGAVALDDGEGRGATA
jgi:hypothetical protein